MPDVLYTGFLRAANERPDRPALQVGGHVFAYGWLREKACSVAATLQKYCGENDPPLSAVFAYRSMTAFAGVLGVLLKGNGYVPLNHTYPIERTRLMLRRSGCRAVVVDRESACQLEQLLSGVEEELCFVTLDDIDWRPFRARWPKHRFIASEELQPAQSWSENKPHEDDIAYLLFTSGSTGTPKGVMVTHGNVRAYLDQIRRRHTITGNDRFSQMFDLTFDLSVADMFVAWEHGACVCCPSRRALMAPREFIRDSHLTVWFSVPSTAIFMKRLGMLKTNLYPTLRLSMFCGEPLPSDVLVDWHQASPNSTIDNLYGPTELTIACTAFRWLPSGPAADLQLSIVPIGEPFPNMDALIVDEDLHEVNEGNTGELIMAGPQLSKGYWQEPERTARSFVVPPGKRTIYYRTGDRVRRLPGGPLVYVGRADNQVKVLGHRVELGELEAVAREVCGVDAAIAIPWPLTPSGAGAIHLFVQSEDLDSELVLKELATRLPSYMVPRSVRALSHFPLNPNGKYDRNALAAKLEAK